jgi:hypothetical protein
LGPPYFLGEKDMVGPGINASMKPRERVTACAYADKYRALTKPQCNGGDGCIVCNLKWEVEQLKRRVLNLENAAVSTCGDKWFPG